MTDEQKLCDEIIWWARFLVAHKINPKIVCADEREMAKYKEKPDDREE